MRDRHSKKLKLFSASQEKPLRSIGNTVRVVGDIDAPDYVIDLLSLGLKHPIKHKFKDPFPCWLFLH